MTSQYVVFKLNNDRFAVEIERVLEIIHAQAVFKVSNSPPYIDGLINLRGKVYSQFNLRKKFNLPTIDDNLQNSKVLIVNLGSSYMGISVDTVEGIVQIEDTSIEKAPSTVAANATNYIKAVANVNDNLILLLDLESLVESSSGLIPSVEVN